MREITRQEINNILEFVRQESYYLQRAWNINPDKIIVAIPNWIVYVIMYTPIYRLNDSCYPDTPNDMTLWGVKKQPHYKDEIVVFYEDYHYNPERYQPKIHQIKIESE